MSVGEKEPANHARKFEFDEYIKGQLVPLLQKDEGPLYEELWDRAHESKTHKPEGLAHSVIDVVRTHAVQALGLLIDKRSSGREKFLRNYLGIVQSDVCPKWQDIAKLGLHDGAVEICGTLVGHGMPMAVAMAISAIVVKIGVDRICQGDENHDGC